MAAVAEWYVIRNNKRHGPYSLAQLQVALANGKISEADRVERDSSPAPITLREALATANTVQSAAPSPTSRRPTTGPSATPEIADDDKIFAASDLAEFERSLNALLDVRRNTMNVMNRRWHQLQEAVGAGVGAGVQPARDVAVPPNTDLQAQVDAQVSLTMQCVRQFQSTTSEISQCQAALDLEEVRAARIADNAGITTAILATVFLGLVATWLVLGTCFGILLTIGGVFAVRFIAQGTRQLWIPLVTQALSQRRLLGLKSEDYRLRISSLKARQSSEAGELAMAAGSCVALQAHVMLQAVQTLNGGRAQVQSTSGTPPVHVAGGWDDARWETWQPSVTSLFLPKLRIGEYREDIVTEWKSRLDPTLLQYAAKHSLPASFPAFVPFIGEDKTIVVACDNGNLEEGLALLHGMLVRIACLFPIKAQFTMLDPATHGRAFPMQQQMRQRRASKEDVYATLCEIERAMKHVYEEVLGDEPQLDLLPEERRKSETFEFIFVANFPEGFDRRSIEKLIQLAKNGPPAGRYFFIHLNKDRESDQLPILANLGNAFVVSPNREYARSYWLLPDPAPPKPLQRDVLTRVREVKPPETGTGAAIVALQKGERWWGADATDSIRAPIAVGGAKSIEISFGKNCAHGLLVGMTNSGKSTLYHTLIYGLCMRYSPDDLQLYLVDGKQGVEFQHYLLEHRLDPQDPERAARFQKFSSLGVDLVMPHIAVVSLRTTPSLSCSILQHLMDEQARRNAIFTKVGVKDLEGYALRGHPEGKLPRILLIVDEYQEFFDDDQVAEQASALLAKLAQQARSAGIHMLLGSQKVGAAGMTQQDQVFGNMQLRLGMMLNETEILALPHFGAEGKQMLKACDEKGKIVVNDLGGRDGRNQFGKVAYLDETVRDQWALKQLELTSTPEFRRTPRKRARVIHGWHQPRFLDNPVVTSCLEASAKTGRRLDPRELEALARRDPSDAQSPGFGCPTWLAAECPIGLWIGQLLQVDGHAQLVLRRDVGQHAAVVGGAPQARLGILAAALLSTPVLYPRDRVAIRIIDGSLRDSSSHGKLQAVHERLFAPLGYDSLYRDQAEEAESLVVDLAAELGRRAAGEIERTSTLIVLNELERYRNAHRVALGAKPTPFATALKKLLNDGPSLGMHVIVSASTLISLFQVIDDRSDFQQVNHRVTLQISAEDSFKFLGNRLASQLQKDGDTPVLGLYVNLAQGRAGVRFKPFDVEQVLADLPTLATSLQRIAP